MRHIPKPLIEKIAHQKYKERLKEGLEGNADKDWEEASEYLINRPLDLQHPEHTESKPNQERQIVPKT